MLQIFDLSYRYPHAAAAQLSVASFNVAAGQHAVLVGPSGSGKSTLLHLMAAILTPQDGKLRVAGTDLASLSPRSADDWRGRTIGFLPQKLALIPSLTARENILLAAYAGNRQADPARADAMLHVFDLAEQASSKPHQLSQGQRQRVALARAMFNRPKLLLADEPTANLDDAACSLSIALMLARAAEIGASLIIATHDARVLGALPQASVLRLSAPVSKAAA